MAPSISAGEGNDLIYYFLYILLGAGCLAALVWVLADKRCPQRLYRLEPLRIEALMPGFDEKTISVSPVNRLVRN